MLRCSPPNLRPLGWWPGAPWALPVGCSPLSSPLVGAPKSTCRVGVGGENRQCPRRRCSPVLLRVARPERRQRVHFRPFGRANIEQAEPWERGSRVSLFQSMPQTNTRPVHSGRSTAPEAWKACCFKAHIVEFLSLVFFLSCCILYSYFSSLFSSSWFC